MEDAKVTTKKENDASFVEQSNEKARIGSDLETGGEEMGDWQDSKSDEGVEMEREAAESGKEEFVTDDFANKGELESFVDVENSVNGNETERVGGKNERGGLEELRRENAQSSEFAGILEEGRGLRHDLARTTLRHEAAAAVATQLAAEGENILMGGRQLAKTALRHEAAAAVATHLGVEGENILREGRQLAKTALRHEAKAAVATHLSASHFQNEDHLQTTKATPPKAAEVVPESKDEDGGADFEDSYSGDEGGVEEGEFEEEKKEDVDASAAYVSIGERVASMPVGVWMALGPCVRWMERGRRAIRGAIKGLGRLEGMGDEMRAASATLLVAAAGIDAASELRLLMALGVPVNAGAPPHGVTALHVAGVLGRLEMCLLLLALGADPCVECYVPTGAGPGAPRPLFTPSEMAQAAGAPDAVVEHLQESERGVQRVDKLPPLPFDGGALAMAPRLGSAASNRSSVAFESSKQNHHRNFAGFSASSASSAKKPDPIFSTSSSSSKKQAPGQSFSGAPHRRSTPTMDREGGRLTSAGSIGLAPVGGPAHPSLRKRLHSAELPRGSLGGGKRPTTSSSSAVSSTRSTTTTPTSADHEHDQDHLEGGGGGGHFEVPLVVDEGPELRQSQSLSSLAMAHRLQTPSSYQPVPSFATLPPPQTSSNLSKTANGPSRLRKSERMARRILASGSMVPHSAFSKDLPVSLQLWGRAGDAELMQRAHVNPINYAARCQSLLFLSERGAGGSAFLGPSAVGFSDESERRIGSRDELALARSGVLGAPSAGATRSLPLLLRARRTLAYTRREVPSDSESEEERQETMRRSQYRPQQKLRIGPDGNPRRTKEDLRDQRKRRRKWAKKITTQNTQNTQNNDSAPELPNPTESANPPSRAEPPQQPVPKSQAVSKSPVPSEGEREQQEEEEDVLAGELLRDVRLAFGLPPSEAEVDDAERAIEEALEASRGRNRLDAAALLVPGAGIMDEDDDEEDLPLKSAASLPPALDRILAGVVLPPKASIPKPKRRKTQARPLWGAAPKPKPKTVSPEEQQLERKSPEESNALSSTMPAKASSSKRRSRQKKTGSNFVVGGGALKQTRSVGSLLVSASAAESSSMLAGSARFRKEMSKRMDTARQTTAAEFQLKMAREWASSNPKEAARLAAAERFMRRHWRHAAEMMGHEGDAHGRLSRADPNLRRVQTASPSAMNLNKTFPSASFEPIAEEHDEDDHPQKSTTKKTTSFHNDVLLQPKKPPLSPLQPTKSDPMDSALDRAPLRRSQTAPGESMRNGRAAKELWGLARAAGRAALAGSRWLDLARRKRNVSRASRHFGTSTNEDDSDEEETGMAVRTLLAGASRGEDDDRDVAARLEALEAAEDARDEWERKELTPGDIAWSGLDRALVSRGTTSSSNRAERRREQLESHRIRLTSPPSPSSPSSTKSTKQKSPSNKTSKSPVRARAERTLAEESEVGLAGFASTTSLDPYRNPPREGSHSSAHRTARRQAQRRWVSSGGRMASPLAKFGRADGPKDHHAIIDQAVAVTKAKRKKMRPPRKTSDEYLLKEHTSRAERAKRAIEANTFDPLAIAPPSPVSKKQPQSPTTPKKSSSSTTKKRSPPSTKASHTTPWDTEYTPNPERYTLNESLVSEIRHNVSQGRSNLGRTGASATRALDAYRGAPDQLHDVQPSYVPGGGHGVVVGGGSSSPSAGAYVFRQGDSLVTIPESPI